MILAIARATHPGPAVLVTAVTVLLGVAVGLEPWRVVLLGVAMAADQASVGLSNDWIDADRDRAVGRRDKPVALGQVSAATARAAAIGGALLAVALTAPLGWPALVAHTVALASAWSYNAYLKRTPLSFLPYVVSFGLLPAIVTLARAEPALPAWWAVLAGALLGLAAHIANALPDVEDDRRTGVAGLPHRIPRPAAVVVTWVSLLGAAVAFAVGVGSLAAFAGLAASVAIAAVGLTMSLRRPSRWGFRLVLLAALVDVVVLVLAGARLTG